MTNASRKKELQSHNFVLFCLEWLCLDRFNDDDKKSNVFILCRFPFPFLGPGGSLVFALDGFSSFTFFLSFFIQNIV